MKISSASVLFCLLPALSLLPHAAQTETLSEEDIRGIYAEADAAMLDAAKTHAIMEKRFDDKLQFSVDSTRMIEGAPPQTSSAKLTKAQVIDADAQTRAMAKIGSHSNAIQGIKFSPDGKWAFVSDTTAIAGTMSVPVPNGASVSVAYTDRLGCVDTLTLKADVIKLMASSCKEIVEIKKP